MSDFVITADEEMYTIPAIRNAGRKAPKTSHPRTNPAPKFARSIVPAVPIWVRRASSRSRLNSSPRKRGEDDPEFRADRDELRLGMM